VTPEAATTVATLNKGKTTLEILHDRIAIGVTRVFRTAADLRKGKQLEKLPHSYYSWSVSFHKQEKRQMFLLETKQF
jgi:hypothetical protein